MTPRNLADFLAEDIGTLPCWIDPFILPKRGILLFGGEAKASKSFFMMEMARALSTGTVMFGNGAFRVTEQSRVLLVDQEVGEYGLHKRLKRIFARHNPSMYRDHFAFLTQQPEWRFDTQQGREHILKTISEFKPNVVMLDPIARFHGGEEQSSTEIGNLFREIYKMMQLGAVENMSVVLSHHFRKPPTGRNRDDYNPLDPYNFRGSSEWFGVPDTIMTLNRLPSPVKDRWTVQAGFRLRHGEEPPDMEFIVTPESNTATVTFGRYLTPPGATFMTPPPKAGGGLLRL